MDRLTKNKVCSKKLVLQSLFLLYIISLNKKAYAVDPITIHTAVMAYDQMHLQKQATRLNALKDEIFFTSLLELQQGVMDLQKGQILLLRSMDALNQSFKTSLSEANLEHAYDELMGSTDLLFTELKALQHDTKLNNSNDIKRILANTEIKYNTFQEKRATFFRKANDVELAIELQTEVLWETERIFMEAIDLPAASKIAIAYDYLNRIRSYLDIPQQQRWSRLSKNTPTKETIGSKERMYFERITMNGLGVTSYIDFGIDEHLPVYSSVPLLGGTQTGFVCGERTTVSGFYAYYGYLQDYQSQELKALHNYGTFINEGPSTVKNITKNRSVSLQGFRVDIKEPGYTLTPYYNGFGLIEGSENFSIKFTKCDASTKNHKNVRACENPYNLTKIEGWINSNKLTTLCDIPQKPTFTIFYDGTSLLDKFVKKERKSLEKNQEVVSVSYRKAANQYNENLTHYRFYNIAVNSLRLAEERILDYLISLKTSQESFNEHEFFAIEAEMITTSNLVNSFRLSKETRFDKEINEYSDTLYQQYRQRQKGIKEFDDKMNQYYKIAAQDVGLKSMRELVTMIGYTIKAADLINQYAISQSTNETNTQNELPRETRKPATASTFEKDSISMSEIQSKLTELEMKYAQNKNIPGQDLNNDINELSDAFSKLVEIEDRHADKKSAVAQLLEKSDEQGLKYVLKQLLGKISSNVITNMIKSDDVGNATTLGTSNIILQEERASRLAIEIINRKTSSEGIYINNTLY
jgi:hypothetical protein